MKCEANRASWCISWLLLWIWKWGWNTPPKIQMTFTMSRQAEQVTTTVTSWKNIKSHYSISLRSLALEKYNYFCAWLIKHYVIKAYGGVDIEIHNFLSAAQVSGQLHLSVALQTIRIWKGAAWAAESIWTIWRTENILSYRDTNSALWVVQDKVSWKYCFFIYLCRWSGTKSAITAVI
jgi:hypothetical protein